MNAILPKALPIPKSERPKKIKVRSESAEMVIPYYSVQANANSSLKTNPKSSVMEKSIDKHYSGNKMDSGRIDFTDTPIKSSAEDSRRKDFRKIQFSGKDTKNNIESHKSMPKNNKGNIDNAHLKEATSVRQTDKVIIKTTKKGEKKKSVLVNVSEKKKTVKAVQNDKTNKLGSKPNRTKNEKSVAPSKNSTDSVMQKRLSADSIGIQKNKMGIIKAKVKSNQSTLINKITSELTIAKSLNLFQNTIPTVSKISSVGFISHVSKVIIQSQSPGLPNNAVFKVDGGELGDIEIKLFQQQAATKAIIVVETNSAKSSMEKLLTTVKENLMNKGIKLESFNVEVDSGRENKSSKAKNFQRMMKMDITLKEEIETNTTRPHIRDYGYNTLEVVA
ncbi:MAG TPA: hypothetical protein ENH49_06800 [Candidatus Marinimicrobia bacterium]|nr:hypothetical protein [Candidatus Neomarinimicrobiota bacterium]